MGGEPEGVEISALSYILVPVHHLETIRDWYRDVLELPLLSDGPSAVEFAIGDMTLAFYECPEAVAAGETDGLYIAFEVHDLDEHCATLQGRGVEFTNGIETKETHRVANARDPEGNQLGFTQHFDAS